MTKRRKRNWNAGLTLVQQAIARRTQAEQIRAFEDERARGALGAPGSMWEIVDGVARLRVAEDGVGDCTPDEAVHRDLFGEVWPLPMAVRGMPAAEIVVRCRGTLELFPDEEADDWTWLAPPRARAA